MASTYLYPQPDWAKVENAVAVDRTGAAWQSVDGKWYEAGGSSEPASWGFLLRHRAPVRQMKAVEGTEVSWP